MDNAYGGMSYERYLQRNDDSKTHKLKTAYWATKQAVFKKLGKKEDEHIVASDSQLDAKLELYKSIQKTCNDLSYLTDKYMECICVLSQIENEFGRFLKKQSHLDKTRAGDMMSVTGRSLGHSSQQRLLLRAPLERFYQEINTFRHRAVADTNETLKKMESKRTDYRGSLMWMKKVSEQLDPDTYKELDKFRKVQAQVKKSKDSFDKIKIDSMQKIDLLSASRCNMLSQALVGYQNALINFWDKTSKTMSIISDSFKGYQYYEFSMLKELNIETKRLADETSLDSKEKENPSSCDNNSDDLLGDFKSEDDDETYKENSSIGMMKNSSLSSDYFASLGLESPAKNSSNNRQDKSDFDEKINQENWIIDLLNNETVSHEDKEFFAQIFNFGDESKNASNSTKPGNNLDFLRMSNDNDAGMNEFNDFQGFSSTNQVGEENSGSGFLPSQLWTQQKNQFNFSALNPQKGQVNTDNFFGSLSSSNSQDSKNKSAENSNWMNLFSELDPSSNPDKLCKKPEDITEV